jgi:hypothetical protein
MAALVQTYPQQTTVTMLQARPSSSGGYTPAQPQQHLGSRNAPSQKYNASSGSGSYRGMPSHGPVAPYAFTSTPQLANTGISSRQYQSHSPQPRSENRTSSAPVIPQAQQASLPSGAAISARQRHPTSSPISNSSPSTSPNLAIPRSMDDTSISLRSAVMESFNRPRSMLELPVSSSMASANSTSSAKPSPDRYRRNMRRVDSGDSGPNRTHHASATPSGSGMAAIGHLYTHHSQSNSSPALQSYQSFRGTVHNAGDQTRKASVDDINLARPQNAELAKRYRRRSLGSLETAGLNHAADEQYTSSPHPNAFILAPSSAQLRDSRNPSPAHKPSSSHTHNGSSDSVSSAKSGHSSQPQSVSGEFHHTLRTLANLLIYRQETTPAPILAALNLPLSSSCQSPNKKLSSSVYLPVQSIQTNEQTLLLHSPDQQIWPMRIPLPRLLRPQHPTALLRSNSLKSRPVQLLCS